MITWVPVYSTLTDSTVWMCSKEVKILWVTMLVRKDPLTGIVELPLPGLARAAVLTLEETVAALKVLESPDPHSQSKEHEGRRIQKVDRGWLILNHEHYQDAMQQIRIERRRAYQALKQRQYRAERKAELEKLAKDYPTVPKSVSRAEQEFVNNGGAE